MLARASSRARAPTDTVRVAGETDAVGSHPMISTGCSLQPTGAKATAAASAIGAQQRFIFAIPFPSVRRPSRRAQPRHARTGKGAASAPRSLEAHRRWPRARISGARGRGNARLRRTRGASDR